MPKTSRAASKIFCHKAEKRERQRRREGGKEGETGRGQEPLANKGGQQERGLASLVPSARTAARHDAANGLASPDVRHKVGFFNCKSGTRAYFELATRPRLVFPSSSRCSGFSSDGSNPSNLRNHRLEFRSFIDRCLSASRPLDGLPRSPPSIILDRRGALSVLSFALCFPADPACHPSIV